MQRSLSHFLCSFHSFLQLTHLSSQGNPLYLAAWLSIRSFSKAEKSEITDIPFSQVILYRHRVRALLDCHTSANITGQLQTHTLPSTTNGVMLPTEGKKLPGCSFQPALTCSLPTLCSPALNFAAHLNHVKAVDGSEESDSSVLSAWVTTQCLSNGPNKVFIRYSMASTTAARN